MGINVTNNVSFAGGIQIGSKSANSRDLSDLREMVQGGRVPKGELGKMAVAVETLARNTKLFDDKERVAAELEERLEREEATDLFYNKELGLCLSPEQLFSEEPPAMSSASVYLGADTEGQSSTIDRETNGYQMSEGDESKATKKPRRPRVSHGAVISQETRIEIGNRLRTRMVELKLSVRRLRAISGISEGTIFNICYNMANPRLEKYLDRLESVLKMNQGDLTRGLPEIPRIHYSFRATEDPLVPIRREIANFIKTRTGEEASVINPSKEPGSWVAVTASGVTYKVNFVAEEIFNPNK